MSNLGVANNNPGNLTICAPGQVNCNPNAVIYPGQSGSMTSPNGFTYAMFPDPTTGFNALVDYISRHINNGVNTLAGITKLFGGTDQYTANVSSATGIDPNATINTNQSSQIAVGIAKAEGTSSIVPPSATAGITSTSANTGNWWDNILAGVGDIADYPAALMTGILGGDTKHTITGQPANNGPATQTGAQTGQGINQTAKDVAASVDPLAWIKNNWLELLLVGGGIIIVVFSVGGVFSSSGSKVNIQLSPGLKHA